MNACRALSRCVSASGSLRLAKGGPARDPLGPRGSGQALDVSGHVQGLARQLARAPYLPVHATGLGQKRDEPGLDPPEPELPALLDRLLQQRDRLGDVALLQVGSPEMAEGKDGVGGIQRSPQPLLTRRDTRRSVAPHRLEPPDGPRGVALEPGIPRALPDGGGRRQRLEGGPEFPEEGVVEPESSMRLTEEVLLADSFQQGHGASPVRDPLAGLPGPVPFEGQGLMRLAGRHAVAAARRRLDGAARVPDRLVVLAPRSAGLAARAGSSQAVLLHFPRDGCLADAEVPGRDGLVLPPGQRIPEDRRLDPLENLPQGPARS